MKRFDDATHLGRVTTPAVPSCRSSPAQWLMVAALAAIQLVVAVRWLAGFGATGGTGRMLVVVATLPPALWLVLAGVRRYLRSRVSGEPSGRAP